MNRLAWLIAPSLAVSLCAGSGCTNQDETVYVLDALELTEVASVCSTPAAGPTALAITEGELDVGGITGTTFANPGYLFAPNMVNGAQVDGTDPNVHILNIEGFDTQLVAVNDASSEAMVAALSGMNMVSRTQHVSIGILPAAFSAPIFPLVDPNQAAAIQQALHAAGVTEDHVQVIVNMVPFGTIDDHAVSGSLFQFPLTFCDGCGVTYLGKCSDYPMSFTGSPGGACNLLQDGLLECCTGDNGNLVCPAVGTMMMSTN